LEPYFGPVCFQLDYKTAKAERVIARVEVILRACQFDDEEQMQYDEYTEEIARAKKFSLTNLESLASRTRGSWKNLPICGSMEREK
jgi:superfamily II DNA or RNA helicase